MEGGWNVAVGCTASCVGPILCQDWLTPLLPCWILFGRWGGSQVGFLPRQLPSTHPCALPQVSDDLSVPEEFFTPQASPSQQSTGEFVVSMEEAEQNT